MTVFGHPYPPHHFAFASLSGISQKRQRLVLWQALPSPIHAAILPALPGKVNCFPTNSGHFPLHFTLHCLYRPFSWRHPPALSREVCQFSANPGHFLPANPHTPLIPLTALEAGGRKDLPPASTPPRHLRHISPVYLRKVRASILSASYLSSATYQYNEWISSLCKVLKSIRLNDFTLIVR